jgi:uncharacterized protein (DUF58 family)
MAEAATGFAGLPPVGWVLSPFLRFRRYLDRSLFQLHGRETGTIVLNQRRIFILPSRHGIVYGAALFFMLTGSVNYDLSLGFVLTFLLAALGINSILHTFRNLVRLKIAPGRVQPVFAGNQAQFGVVLDNGGGVNRYSIGIRRGKDAPVYTDVPARQATTITVPIPAPQRGLLYPGRLTLFTHYPLGLCYAWAYADLDVKCLVYPRPETGRVALPPASASRGTGTTQGAGEDDFAGLRSFRTGDPPRHVAWKAVARGQELLTKQFSGLADAELWLDWDLLPPGLGVEARLSRLTRWVLDAHAAALSFGMRIPGVKLPPAPGDAQRDRCLEVLALFNEGATA